MIGILKEIKKRGRKIMAERRMFSKAVVHSGAFLELPASAQLLYFHLGMQADDDGFISNPKPIVRMVRGTSKSFRCLVEQGFLIEFPNGVCVLRHWLLNNQIRSDRYKPTVYQEEKEALHLEENKTYALGGQNGNQRETQYRLDKTRQEKTSLDKASPDETRAGKLPLSQRRFVF